MFPKLYFKEFSPRLQREGSRYVMEYNLYKKMGVRVLGLAGEETAIRVGDCAGMCMMCIYVCSECDKQKKMGRKDN